MSPCDSFRFDVIDNRFIDESFIKMFISCHQNLHISYMVLEIPAADLAALVIKNKDYKKPSIVEKFT